MPYCGSQRWRRTADCPTTLLDALQPGSFNDENEGFASKEAESIYDEVFFFTDERTLQLPENELVAELKRITRTGSSESWNNNL